MGYENEAGGSEEPPAFCLTESVLPPDQRKQSAELAPEGATGSEPGLR